MIILGFAVMECHRVLTASSTRQSAVTGSTSGFVVSSSCRAPTESCDLTSAIFDPHSEFPRSTPFARLWKVRVYQILQSANMGISNSYKLNEIYPLHAECAASVHIADRWTFKHCPPGVTPVRSMQRQKKPCCMRPTVHASVFRRSNGETICDSQSSKQKRGPRGHWLQPPAHQSLPKPKRCPL